MAWTAPRTWVAGEVVSAAIMNAHVRDNLLAIGGAAVAWTPTLVGFTVSATVARAWQMGKQIAFEFAFTLNAAPSGAPCTMTLPAAASTVYGAFGAMNRGFITGLRTGASYRNAAVLLQSATTAGFASDAAPSLWTAGVPVAWASGDVWHGWGNYEAA